MLGVQPNVEREEQPRMKALRWAGLAAVVIAAVSWIQFGGDLLHRYNNGVSATATIWHGIRAVGESAAAVWLLRTFRLFPDSE